MAKTLQHRRGTTTELASVTGAVGEIFMDTTKNTLVVFDGQSPSAPHTLATEAFVLANSGGGSGSSYNQSLNTTDDIVFNSGLIGNVTIIADQIAGVDSYGKESELILKGGVPGVSIVHDVVTTTTFNYDVGQQSLIPDPMAMSTSIIGFDQYIGGQVVFDKVALLKNGDTIVITNGMLTSTMLSGNIPGTITIVVDHVVVTPAGGTTLPYVGVYTKNVTSTGGAGNYAGVDITIMSADGSTPIHATVHTSSSIPTKILKSSSAGITLDGSILSDKDFNITIDGTSTVTTSYNRDTDGYWMGSSAWIAGSNTIYIGTFMGSTYTTRDALLAAVPGDKLTFQSGGAGIYTPVTVTLATPLVYNTMQNRYEATVVETNPSSVMDTDFSSDPTVMLTIEHATGAVQNYTFDTTGAFTSDSVVATSALLGDVSIIGNTIAALDSYGNASTLSISAPTVTFDSDLNLAINSLVQTTETITVGMTQMFDLSTNFTCGMPSDWVDASKFVTGSIVTYPVMGSGSKVIQLTSDMTYMSPSGWSASYTVISGSGSTMQTTTVTVENSTGATTNYSFDDQGTFTAPTVSTNSLSTNSLLINGSAPALLTANIDGSKSIVVDKLITSSYAGQMMNNDPTKVHWNNTYWNGTMNGGYQGKLQFTDPNTFTINLFSSLVAGDQITLKRDLGAGTPGEDVTLTVQTAGFTYDMAQMRYILDVVETNTNMDAWSFLNTYGVTVTSLGSQEHNFSGSALTTNSVIATDALIGDVSIVGNTISGVDSYGNADELVVDGDLSITGQTKLFDIAVTNTMGSTFVQGPQLVVNYAGPSQGISGTRVVLAPSEVSTANIVSGTTNDGGYVYRKTFGGKSDAALSPSFAVILPEAASLNGDISIIEIIVSAIRINTSSSPNQLQSKSWKLRGYATKLDNVVTFNQIGTGPEVLADINSASFNPNVTLSKPPTSAFITLECNDTLGGDWTWGGEYTVTTTHVLVPAAGGGGR